jgi:putative protein kinase ArgK-like GTPase of G3E family
MSSGTKVLKTPFTGETTEEIGFKLQIIKNGMVNVADVSVSFHLMKQTSDKIQSNGFFNYVCV